MILCMGVAICLSLDEIKKILIRIAEALEKK